MNENEKLARWLGFTEKTVMVTTRTGAYPRKWWEKVPNTLPQFTKLPSFRTDNEWAGVLLDRLGHYEITLDPAKVEGKVVWFVDFFGEPQQAKAETWRDAIVDAALEIFKREGV